MEDLRSAMEDHIDQMSDLLQKFSAELRSGVRPAYDNFIGFFHAIDWKVTLNSSFLFSVCLAAEKTEPKSYAYSFPGTLAYWLAGIPFPVAANNRFFEEESQLPNGFVPFGIYSGSVWFTHSMAGVYLAERLNSLLGKNWKSFASQNYFDPNGLFLSVLWSGPLLFIAIIILINTLFSLCHLIVRWKKAELRHRARLARNKQD
ncbi:hypothetical protein L484_016443 [Morus notabilis]|uniref:Uncharacterized protein n=1 Tax=Morus notabilis TaxID=981085 RepID=W9R801_9ROSA|nr:hypothetical protein L484_016443 [Morus notabilis]